MLYAISENKLHIPTVLFHIFPSRVSLSSGNYLAQDEHVLFEVLIIYPGWQLTTNIHLCRIRGLKTIPRLLGVLIVYYSANITPREVSQKLQRFPIDCMSPLSASFQRTIILAILRRVSTKAMGLSRIF